MLIISKHQPVRGWLSDAANILGHVPVVTASEEEAIRVLQILHVDMAIVDCFGFSDADPARIMPSLRSLSANEALPVICIVGPASSRMFTRDGIKAERDVIELPWPITVTSLKRAIAELLLQQSDNQPLESEPFQSQPGGN